MAGQVKTCTSSGCDGAVLGRGLCSTCYGRAWRSDTLPPLDAPRHSLSDINTDDRTATCAVCGTGVSIYLRRGRRPECREARLQVQRRRRKATSEEQRRWKYRIDRDQWDALKERAAGKCESCGDPLPDDYHVDHCHDSDVVRGLLCPGCNIGIGWFRDDPQRLRAAADYLLRSTAPR